MPDEIALPHKYEDDHNSRPELSAAPADKKPIIIGLVAALIIILALVGSGWLLFSYPAQTSVLRDIVIIFMGLGVVLIILLLITLIVITAYLVIKVNDLVQLLDREIRPVLARMQKTLTTVSGTATFLSDQAVQPVINAASTVAAVQTIVRALFRRN